MNILIACEESQRVTIEFRKLGHNAFSCDIIDCSGGHPEWHIKQDVLPLLNGNCSFKTVDGELHTVDGKWDMIIAHPACTRLCTTGQRWLYYGDKKYRSKKISEQQKAIVFFMRIALADCEKIAIENPQGIMSTAYRKPDCIYNPYDFEGETECKKNLPLAERITPFKTNEKSAFADFKKNTRNFQKSF